MKFGTDGLRGRAGTEITTGLAGAVGRAAVAVFGSHVALAADPRPSSPELLEAAAAGVVAAGGRAIVLGVLPTPGLSAIVAARGYAAGVMITASHNPPEDNGLKVLGPGGHKLDDGALSAFQAAMAVDVAVPGGERVDEDATEAYVAALVAALPPGRWLTGRKLLFDAAAGAGARSGLAVLTALGAEVTPFAGPAVNTGCGAVHPAFAAAEVLARGLDGAVVLDGDGDRIALVDRTGRVLDGDALLWLCRRGPAMVGTIMSNLGLERALLRDGIALHRADVGDARVAARMRETGARIGGEPSGHLLFSDGPPTADGLFAGLSALAAAPTLDTAGYVSSHQAHAAVRDVVYHPVDTSFVEDAGGRAVVRPSGTEPVVRVMVEHDDRGVAEALLGRLVAEVRAASR